MLARRLQQGVGTGAVPVGTDQPGWTWSPGLAAHERQSVMNETQQQRVSGGGGIPHPSAGFAVGTVYHPPGPGYNSYGATYNTSGQVTNWHGQSPDFAPPPPPPPARQPLPDHPPPPGPQPPPPPAVAVYNTTGQVVNVGQPSTGPAPRTLTLADGMVINGDVGPHVRLAASGSPLGPAGPWSATGNSVPGPGASGCRTIGPARTGSSAHAAVPLPGDQPTEGHPSAGTRAHARAHGQHAAGWGQQGGLGEPQRLQEPGGNPQQAQQRAGMLHSYVSQECHSWPPAQAPPHRPCTTACLATV